MAYQGKTEEEEPTQMMGEHSSLLVAVSPAVIVNECRREEVVGSLQRNEIDDGLGLRP